MLSAGDDFKDITPSPGLAGWTELPYTFTFPPSSFEDLARRGVDVVKLRTTPVQSSGQWYADEVTGHLVCKGDSHHSWLRFDRVLRDFQVHVEWRFKKLHTHTRYNSGVFIRNDPVRNLFTQVETGFDRRTAGFFFTKKFHFGEKCTFYGTYPSEGEGDMPFDPFLPQAPALINPPGAWNSYDIQVVGRQAELLTNGVRNNMFECEVDEGYFGLEAERYWIEFRNILLKDL